MNASAPPEVQLRSASLRVTRPRLAVLDAVRGTPHADADTIAREVRARLGSVSTQAVYNVLAALTEANLLRRIEPAGSPARYETRVGDNHHHVVCRVCGAMADVDCAVDETPCLEADDPHGFVIDEAEVTYWGLCPRCQKRSGRSVSSMSSMSSVSSVSSVSDTTSPQGEKSHEQ
jgi:Fur family ferric uptake transcriptional regulator